MTQAKPLCCDTDAGRVLADRAGGAVAPEPVPVSALSGAHPSRDDFLLRHLDRNYRSLASLRIASNTRLLIGPAQRLTRRGLVESAWGLGQSHLVYRLTVRGILAKHGRVPNSIGSAHPIAPGVTGEGGQ